MYPSSESADGPPEADRRYELNQAEAGAILEGSAFDSALGLRMAKDAIAVANGDLDEETFHERHHEAVVAEFGADRRPTAPEVSTDE